MKNNISQLLPERTVIKDEIAIELVRGAYKNEVFKQFKWLIEQHLQNKTKKFRFKDFQCIRLTLPIFDRSIPVSCRYNGVVIPPGEEEKRLTAEERGNLAVEAAKEVVKKFDLGKYWSNIDYHLTDKKKVNSNKVIVYFSNVQLKWYHFFYMNLFKDK
jgi:hypothetical protein